MADDRKSFFKSNTLLRNNMIGINCRGFENNAVFARSKIFLVIIKPAKSTFWNPIRCLEHGISGHATGFYCIGNKRNYHCHVQYSITHLFYNANISLITICPLKITKTQNMTKTVSKFPLLNHQ